MCMLIVCFDVVLKGRNESEGNNISISQITGFNEILIIVKGLEN